MHIRNLITTRQNWNEFTKGETNLFNLIEKGAKYEKYHTLYSATLKSMKIGI
jgi:hypothetical protein